MTIVDDRLDIEVEEVTEEQDQDFTACCRPDCDAEPDWIVFYSCGHAFPYCAPHLEELERATAFRQMLFGRSDVETCKGTDTRIVRKEPAR